jgi:ribonucleoside-diphosphate reductase alpha chain/ribonucleoside-triphosphate reductase
MKRLLDAERYSVRMAIRMTLPTLELPEWDKAQKVERVTGCSLTGWQDAMNAIGASSKTEKTIKQLGYTHHHRL